MFPGNARIIGPLRATDDLSRVYDTTDDLFRHQHSVFVSEWAEDTLSKYWQLFLLVHAS